MISVLKEHLFNIMSAIDEVVWCVDANSFNILHVNEACFNMWGYSAAEMMSDNSIFMNSIHPADLEIYQRGIAAAIENGRSHSEFRIRHKDGSIRYIKGDAIFKPAMKGLPATITGITTDITEIKVMNESLLSKNEELEAILAELGILKNDKEKITSLLRSYQSAIDTNIICSITDKKGVITYVNDNFCRVSQYSKEEMIGRTHRVVNSGYHSRKFFAGIWKSLNAGKMWTGEIMNKAKDGSYYWVESVIMPMKDYNNEIIGFLSLRILINDRKKMEKERTAYLNTIENMLFMVSHEIRKPITTCQGILQLLHDRDSLSETEYFEFISHMESSASELDSYSRKLNDYLRNNIKPSSPAKA